MKNNAEQLTHLTAAGNSRSLVGNPLFSEVQESTKVVHLSLLHHPLLDGEDLHPQLPAQVPLVDLIVDICFCPGHLHSINLVDITGYKLTEMLETWPPLHREVLRAESP